MPGISNKSQRQDSDNHLDYILDMQHGEYPWLYFMFLQNHSLGPQFPQVCLSQAALTAIRLYSSFRSPFLRRGRRSAVVRDLAMPVNLLLSLPSHQYLQPFDSPFKPLADLLQVYGVWGLRLDQLSRTLPNEFRMESEKSQML